MSYCKLATALAGGEKLLEGNEPGEIRSNILCRQLAGSLLYVSPVFKSDMSFLTGFVLRHLDKYSKRHSMLEI